MKIPSVDEWPLQEFLDARKAQMEACKSQPDPLAEKLGIKPEYIEAGEEIVCDSCNAEILDPTIILVEFGRRAVCGPCYRKWYIAEPLKYRVLNPDGSLGKYTTPSVEEK